MMELCKSESEGEDLLDNENESTETCTQKEDEISSQNDKINNETEIDSNDLNVQITTNDNEIVKQIDVSKTVADESNSQLQTATDTNTEFSNDLRQEGNTSAEICLVYNDSVEENQTDVNLDNEAYETNDDNVNIQGNNELTVENSELNTPDNSHLISLYYNDTEKVICTEDFAFDSEKTFTGEKKQPDEHAFSDDDVNMEDIDKWIENAEIIPSMYLLLSSTLYLSLQLNI